MEEKCQIIADSLNRGLLYHAFALLRPLVQLPNADPRWSDRLQSLEQNYDYLTRYFLSGNDDPERTLILHQMTVETYRLVDEISRLRSRADYSAARLRMEEVAHVAIEAQHEAVDTDSDDAVTVYALYKNTLYTFWTYNDWETVRQLWENLVRGNDDELLHMAVAGIILNLFDCFSDVKLQALLDDLLILPPRAQKRAIVGILFVVQQYGDRLKYYPELLQRLQQLTQDSALNVLVQEANQYILETSLTAEVDKVMQSMQSDILPTIAKQDKEKPIILNLDEMEEGNLLWGNKFQDSVGKHIDAMTRLHRDGADFTYSSSKTLLNDAFFQSDIANFFLPFDRHNPQIGIDFDSDNGQMIRKLINLNIEACDSDKYATCLMYKHIQSRIADAVPSNVQEMGNVDIEEMLSAEEKARLALKSEVRNWYRFFLHNPWGYTNALKQADAICRGQMPELLHLNEQDRVVLGNHCMRLHLYKAAIALFEPIEDATVEIYQKIGFAYQKTEQNIEALICFEAALRLQNDDAWTLLHAAQCLRALHNYSDAIAYYDQLLGMFPNKKNYLLQKAGCLLDWEHNEEALQVFFQLDLLYPNELKVQRGLAWCAFLCDRKDTANRYFEQLAFADTANVNDCLNYGHILFCEHHREEALRMYEIAWQKSESVQAFFRLFRQDRDLLRLKGVSAEELALLEDILMQKIKSKHPHLRQ